ncbi:MAG: hypothetical protein GX442_12550 [Candidatus Riflebacteria bacterium]|nr:hypothetical protein [Candidatus Riflebacteria bacterium]
MHSFRRWLLAGLVLCLGAFGLTGCGQVDKTFHRPNLVVLTPEQSRLIILDSAANRILLADRQFRYQGEIAVPEGNKIWGLDITPDNEIAITNRREEVQAFTEEERQASSVAEVLFYSMSGAVTNHLQWKGGDGPINTPAAIRCLPDGTFWVSDFQLNKLVHFDRAGNVLSTFGTFGYDPGQIYYPNDFTIASDGRILVSESYNFRLSLFAPDGTFLRTFGEKGWDEGKLMFPQNVVYDSQGNMHVTEMSTMRISTFAPDGRFLRATYPLKQGMEAEYLQMFGLAVASDTGEMFVADSLNGQVYVIASDGRLVRSLSGLD